MIIDLKQQSFHTTLISMTSVKRRLSVGKALALPVEEVVEEDEIVGFDNLASPQMKRSKGRRRSSMMGLKGGGIMNPQEQLRIVEMYKTVIQMSSENKLNEKNSWSYDLIDHMGNLIKDEESSINFQKASCTLDASVKIYSNRVDDTYASSHRILECLSRNGNSAAEDGPLQPGKAKVGSKASSTRLNITETIERNPALLNAVKLENEFSADPLFHKIGKAFDEGGAKGMLMHNLRTSRDACAISFCYKASTPTDSDTSSSSETTDLPPSALNIAELLSDAGLADFDPDSTTLCSSLAGYRFELGIKDSDLGISSDTAAPIMLAQPLPTDTIVASDPAGGSDYGGDDGVDALGDLLDAAESDNEHTPALADPIQSPEKLQWTMDVSNTPSALEACPMNVQRELELLSVQPSTNDYAFISNDLFVSSAVSEATSTSSSSASALGRAGANDWAGARHWKYATSLRKAAVSKAQLAEAKRKEAVAAKQTSSTLENGADAATGEDSDVENAGAAILGKSRRSAKDAKMFRISFNPISPPPASCTEMDAMLVDEDQLSLPAPGKADSTLLSTAALAKTASAEEINSLFLPADARLNVVDLARLFISPRMVVPTAPLCAYMASSTQSLSSSSSAASALLSIAALPNEQDPSLLSGNKPRDVMWGVWAKPAATRVQQPTSAIDSSAYDDMGNENNDDGYAYNTGDFDDATFVASMEALSSTAETVGGQQLLQAHRKVEKIDIGYAKVSKRINIQRLKSDIWSTITDKLESTSEVVDGGENSPPRITSDSSSGDPPKKVQHPTSASFQDIVSNIASNPRQNDVTLPFYFICLLHLANEHKLKLVDEPGMSDLTIAMDNK